VLTLAFTARAAAGPRFVSRVLTDSALATCWLPGFDGWREAPPSQLSPNNMLRFRAKQNGVPVHGELRVLGMTPGRLRAQVRLGLLDFTASFSISPATDDANATRVGLAVTLENEVPVVGGSLDRFSVREQASQIAESMLGALSAAAVKLRGAPA